MTFTNIRRLQDGGGEVIILVCPLLTHSTVWKLINMKTQLVMKRGSWKEGGSWMSPIPAALFQSAVNLKFY